MLTIKRGEYPPKKVIVAPIKEKLKNPLNSKDKSEKLAKNISFRAKRSRKQYGYQCQNGRHGRRKRRRHKWRKIIGN